MPEGRFRAAPISMDIQVGSMLMLLLKLESLHASTVAKAASGVIDETGLHTEQCKPAAARRAMNRLTGRKFKPSNCVCAASIADRKRQLTNHYSVILNNQHNQPQQQYHLLCSQQWQQRSSIQESAPFTTTKIRAALRTSRNDTSPGLDDIPKSCYEDTRVGGRNHGHAEPPHQSLEY